MKNKTNKKKICTNLLCQCFRFGKQYLFAKVKRSNITVKLSDKNSSIKYMSELIDVSAYEISFIAFVY